MPRRKPMITGAQTMAVWWADQSKAIKKVRRIEKRLMESGIVPAERERLREERDFLIMVYELAWMETSDGESRLMRLPRY
uniref:NS4 n=1 Tax=Ife virus TaxID=2547357 RepID=A0A482AC58_9REOV|nr:NS4 [Ife virus]